MVSAADIRLLISVPSLFRGGAETQFRYLATQLACMGYSVYLLVERQNSEVDYSIDPITNSGVTVLSVADDASRNASGDIAAFFRYRRALASAVCEYRIDICIVYSSFGLNCVPMLKRMGIPSIFSERNQGGFNRSRSSLRIAWKRHCVESANLVVCNSEVACVNWADEGVKTSFIANGIEQIAYKPHDVMRPPISVLIPARICRVKNQLFALEGLKRISGAIEKIRLVGAIEDNDYLQRLVDKIREFEGQTIIEVAGFVADMQHEYDLADIVLLPSLSEGMPNVMLEAYMRGCIVCSSDIPQNSTITLDKRTLFSLGDPDSLAKAVLYAMQLESRDLRELLVRQRDYVTDNYSIERMAHEYDECIKGITG